MNISEDTKFIEPIELTIQDWSFLSKMAYASNNGTHVSKTDLIKLKDIAFRVDIIADSIIRDNQELKVDKKVGEEAMNYIADHPLYASTCGITYDEAIKVAEALNKNWQAEVVEMARFGKLSSKEQLIELNRLEQARQ